MDFRRLPARPKLIELGVPGEWDDGYLRPAHGWVEVEDEWWLYYCGWDGPHGLNESKKMGIARTGAIGLAKVRREGFISMRGPDNGGVIVTRPLRWPGGKLFVNANAKGGALSVRISDARRKVIPGFDYEQSGKFTGDDVRHEVSWGDQSIHSLEGRVIRLEFFLERADIFTFVATGGS